MSESTRRPAPHRVLVTAALLGVAAAACVWYVVSTFADVPGMVAFAALTALNVCYVTWQRRDRRSDGALGQTRAARAAGRPS